MKDLKKYYNLYYTINHTCQGSKTFNTRLNAMHYLQKLLEDYGLQVDVEIKRDNGHRCEYVCDDSCSRFFVDRVIAQ